MGLKTMRKITGERGSPWKTPLLKLKRFDLNSLVDTTDCRAV